MARTRTRTVSKADDNGKKAAVRAQRNDADVEESGQTARKDRPTPSTRDAKPRSSGSTGLIHRIPVVRSVYTYFKGVASEMRKVTWPNREETTRLTGVVLGVTATFAIGLGALDGFFSWWFRQAFHADSEWLFLVVAGGVAVTVSGAYALLRHRI